MAAAAAMLGASLIPALGALAPNTFSQAQTFFDSLFGNGRQKRKGGNYAPYQHSKLRREGGFTQTGPMHTPGLLGGIHHESIKASNGPHARRLHFASGLTPYSGPTKNAGNVTNKYNYYYHYRGRNNKKRNGGDISGVNVPISDIPSGPMP